MLTRPTDEARPQNSRLLLFSIFVGISLLVWWRPLLSTFALASHDGEYTHILLILPVSIALICLGWKSSDTSIKSGASFGYILLGMAIAVTAFARLQLLPLQTDEQLAANMLGLVLWWTASFLVCFGFRAFRRALFPLGFLLWMVPFPNFLLNPIVRLLQDGSAASARILLAICGVPVAQDGTLLAIPGLTIEVARECSSIRSSLMLVVTTMVLAQISLHSIWRKALVIAVAIPLSVAKNGLRIFVLAMLTTRVDRSFITGRLHHQGGIIYFLIALAAIALLIWVLRRSEPKSAIHATPDATFAVLQD